jgi:hypothetical protein
MLRKQTLRIRRIAQGLGSEYGTTDPIFGSMRPIIDDAA